MINMKFSSNGISEPELNSEERLSFTQFHHLITMHSLHSQYGKHVPKILRRQLILQLMQQYLSTQTNVTISNECKPSIQRFHGALLFIDVSGFTALSLQLSPEDLKFHINEYFTKMLDIVDRYCGDVIKFAGDALFVIWETSQVMKQSNETREDTSSALSFEEASKMAVSIAVECGLEINDTCSNHKVSLLPRNATPDSSTTLGQSSGGNPVHNAPFACLNVHSGVSYGLMAGVDIGCNDRWEYFLMGEPLTSVATAEAQASTGEIVICPEAHELIHPLMHPTFNRALSKLSNPVAPPKQRKKIVRERSITVRQKELHDMKSSSFDVLALEMPCGCWKGANGFCKVKKGSKSHSDACKRRQSNISNKFQELISLDEMTIDLDNVFDTFVGHSLQSIATATDIEAEFLKVSTAVSLNAPPVHYAMSSTIQTSMNGNSIVERVRAEFVKWAHSCLIDDIARHVHNVVRSNYVFEDTSRIDVCRRQISKQLNSVSSPDSAKTKDFQENLSATLLKRLTKQSGFLDGTKKFLRKSISYGRLNRLGSKLLDQDQAGFSAEIRSVTVMFVKIDMPHMDLTVEDKDYADRIGQFGFLSKTVNESLADVLLLHQLQSCIEALNEAFSQHGGQMRQFIVDDKGTVCIGTFGLRGAVSDDNAAAAVETAYLIVNKLQTLGLNCSIGLTLGKAFCGLVGSANRHEYAVMGPSTNLSARLMCKAPPGGIICDKEIRNHDRTHEFLPLADIVAKGYKQPVGICKPVVSSNSTYHGKLIARSRQNEAQAAAVARVRDRRMSVHTVQEYELSVNRMFQKLVTGPFKGGVPDASRGSGASDVLIGRDNEIRVIMNVLFSPLIVAGQFKFKVDQPTRFAGVFGPEGIGKSAVIEAVSHQLSNTVVSGRHLAVDIFKTRVSGFHTSVPCSAWKYIVREMLMKLYYMVKQTAQVKPTATRRLGLSVDIAECINCIKGLLSEEAKKHLPLLGYMKIVPEQAFAVKDLQLSADDMVMKCIDLVNEIVNVFVKHTQRLLFIVAENVHSFDIASQLLLHRICTTAVGIVVFYSAERTTPVKSVASPHNGYEEVQADIDMGEGEEQLHLAEMDVINMLMEDEAGYYIQLSLLPREQIEAVINATLAHSGIASVDHQVMAKIYEESGGNPLYASELAKIVAQKQSSGGDGGGSGGGVALKITCCHRLEEIICHRFDQLSDSAQTLLKIAATICCFGSTFTFSMLHFVMVADEHQQTSTDKNLVEDLLDIVNTESFLRGTSKGTEFLNSDRQAEIITPDGCLENRYAFCFSISLERTIIYELLLGDQKQAIHERIAEYFQEQRRLYPEDKSHFGEEGHHWQMTGKWHQALMCSYQASLVETDGKKAEAFVDTAFKMYMTVREKYHHRVIEATGEESANTDNEEWDAEKMKKLYELSLTNSEDLAAFKTHSNWSADEVSQLFECDSHLLVTTLHVIIARVRHRLKNNWAEENREVLEDALQILIVTKNNHAFSTAKVARLMSMLQQTQPLNGEGALGENEAEDHFFTVGSAFLPLCLKFMSLYIENYLHLDSHMELTRHANKIAFMMEKFHALMTGLAEYHELHVMSLNVMLKCKQVDLHQACVISEKLVTSYQFEKHSADLVQFYGCDCIPASLAMISQYLLLSSEWRTPHKFLQLAHQTVERLTHVESIQSAVYFVTNSLVFLKRFDAALKIFSRYLDCGGWSPEARGIQDKFYMDWLTTLVEFASYEQTREESVLSKNNDLFHDIKHIAVTLGDSLCVQGRGIDAVLAEMCALKIIVLWNGADLCGTRMDELRVYCRACSVYVRSTLSMTSGRPHELMFNKTNTVLTVLHLLQHVNNKAVDSREGSPLAKRYVSSKHGPIELRPIDVRNDSPARRELSSRRIRDKDSTENNLSCSSRSTTIRSVAGGTGDETPLDKNGLLMMLVSAVDDELIDSLLMDCTQLQGQQAHCVFAELAISVLTKTKNEVKLSLGKVDAPPTFDANKEVWNLLRQFMSNGSSKDHENSAECKRFVEDKLIVLKSYSLMEMASAMTSQ